MGRYHREYMRRNYRTLRIRKESYEALIQYCMEKGLTYSDCIRKLIEAIESMNELVDAAIRLANKYPREPESRRLFELWEKYFG